MEARRRRGADTELEDGGCQADAGKAEPDDTARGLVAVDLGEDVTEDVGDGEDEDADADGVAHEEGGLGGDEVGDQKRRDEDRCEEIEIACCLHEVRPSEEGCIVG